MLSSEQLLNFGDPSTSFLENNLLDQEDWIGETDLLRYDSSPSSSSLDSDYACSNDVSPISLHNDDIDAWLQDGLSVQQTHQIFQNIKEEPPSPPSINPHEISTPSINPNEITPIQSPVIQQPQSISPITTVSFVLPTTKPPVKKIPISRTPSLKARPIAPLNTKIVTTAKMSMTTPSLTSNISQLKNLPTLPVKTEQLNTAFLPGEKYAIPPKIVKLDNGQYYIARAVLKGKPSKQIPPVPGQKRTSPAVPAASITKEYTELKDLKRQQRMMKNRESASLSRQRKKEHLQSLESKVSEMCAMNAQLIEENVKLKERVQQLESENNQLKVKITVDNPSVMNKENVKKTTTVVMAILLFIIFNPFPLSSRTTSKSGLLIKPIINEIPTTHYRSRSLLQYDNSNNIDNDFDAPFKPKYLRNMLHDSMNTRVSKDREIRFVGRKPILKGGLPDEHTLHEDSKMYTNVDSDCEETFNKTDFNRINKILEGLVKVYDKNENIKRKNAAKKRMPKKDRFASKLLHHNCTDDVEKHRKPLISPYIQRPKNHRRESSKLPRRSEQTKISPVFNNSSQELLNEIKRTVQRKDDTFYVVSMKDFLFLPATNQSQKHRPKFSFIVPTFLQAGNDSSTVQELLQIDCNVLDTKLVRLNKNILSKHFSNQLEPAK